MHSTDLQPGMESPIFDSKVRHARYEKETLVETNSQSD